MKKIINFIKTLALCSFIFAMTGCQDPIFNEIRLEVELEKGSIFGDVYSIIRHGTDIYCSNGNIYKKGTALEDNTHGRWKKVNSPNGHVLKIASDNTNLYALVYTSFEDENDGEMTLESRKLYYSSDEGSTWQECNISLSNRQSTECRLICTNSTTESGRKAYLIYAGKGYTLNGSSVTPDATINGKKSCCWNGSSPVFSAGEAICFADGKKYETYGGRLVIDGTSVSLGRGDITGLAPMGDSILVTTLNGAVLVDFDGNELPFSNLSSTVSALYESRACLALDPTKPALQNTVYASICVEGTGSNSALFSHEGLWSYYPSRGKWNIE